MRDSELDKMLTKDARGKTASALSHEDGFLELVAKGEAELADHLVRMARLHGIPVIENPALADQLEYLPIGGKIPDEVFFALAQLLEYIYGANENTNNLQA